MTAETLPPIDPRTDPVPSTSLILNPDMTRFVDKDPATSREQLYQEALGGLQNRIDQLAADESIWRLDTSIDRRNNPRLAEFDFLTKDGKGVDPNGARTVVRIVDEPDQPRRYEVDYSRKRLNGAIPGRMNVRWSKGDTRVETETPRLRHAGVSGEAEAKNLRFLRVALHHNIAEPKEVPITFESQRYDESEISKLPRIEMAAVWIARTIFRQGDITSFR